MIYALFCPPEEILIRNSNLPARSLSKEFVIASPRRSVLAARDWGPRRSQLQWRLILKDVSYELVDTSWQSRKNFVELLSPWSVHPSGVAGVLPIFPKGQSRSRECSAARRHCLIDIDEAIEKS